MHFIESRYVRIELRAQVYYICLAVSLFQNDVVIYWKFMDLSTSIILVKRLCKVRMVEIVR